MAFPASSPNPSLIPPLKPGDKSGPGQTPDPETSDPNPHNKPGPKTALVKLLYAVWTEDGVRHDPAPAVELPYDLAVKLLAEKKAERNDPLPGN